MLDEPNLETPVQSVVIARASNGTGDGGAEIHAATAPDRPDVIVTVLTPLWVIFIRAGKAYFDALLGLLAAGGLGAATDLLPVHDFASLLSGAAQLSLSVAAVSVLRSVAELFTKLDQKYPTLFGMS